MSLKQLRLKSKGLKDCNRGCPAYHLMHAYSFLCQSCVLKGSSYFAFVCTVITSTKAATWFLCSQRSLGEIIGSVFVGVGELAGPREICFTSCVVRAVCHGEGKIKDIQLP